jgi:hypothetical protein
MDEEQARKVLGGWIQPDDSIRISDDDYVMWTPLWRRAIVDGRLTPERLEALAWWMRAKTLNVNEDD